MRRSSLIRRPLVLASLLAVGALTAGYLSLRPQAEAVVSQPSRLPLYTWTVGEERTYRLVWDDLERVAMPVLDGQSEGGPMEGTLHLDGEFSLQALETRADGTRLRLSLGHFARHEALFAGQALLPDDAALRDQLPTAASAWVELDARGALKAVRFSESDPPLFRQFAQTLVAEVFPADLQDAQEWTAVESTQTGQAEASFRFEDDTRLTRRRAKYRTLSAAQQGATFTQRLGSLTQFERDPDGRMVGMSQDEMLEAHKQDGRPLLSRQLRLRVTFSSRQQKPLPAPGETKTLVRAPGQIAFDTDRERALLLSQAAGMTVDELMETLEDATGPDSIPDLQTFVQRAVAALKLEPGRAGELKRIFLRAGASPGLREFTLDLLVSAGHAQAQATLRELVQSPEAREHAPSHVYMVQRAGFFRKPEPETGAMLLDLRSQAVSSGNVDMERASSYALGALVGHLEKGSPDAAKYLRPLEDDLAQARTAEERHHALRALAGTGSEEVLDLATPHLRAEEPDVRAAAAEALRRAPQEEATRLLLGALDTETQRAVQISLLDALDGRQLEAPELEHLRAWVVQGQLANGAEAALLNVLAHRLDGSSAVVQMLQALSLRPGQHASTRARVLSLMSQASAQMGG